jgi:hypothetical protein
LADYGWLLKALVLPPARGKLPTVDSEGGTTSWSEKEVKNYAHSADNSAARIRGNPDGDYSEYQFPCHSAPAIV